ncbi:telomeric repeat-binding factor 2-interacting protein 1 isoform X2 [Rhinoderma darwinii]|uniref:telomeric repeat-binding factor 2-interacting protein 1 isoform X2 n=1 Tax=Rhinoderma darwinii TaxID=43563 RepID=UPI003F67F7F4
MAPPPPPGFTHSRSLFITDLGPMRFYVRPGPLKSQLAPLISHGGGIMCRVQEPGAFLLAEPGQAQGIQYISSSYITDCVRSDRRLSPRTYRLLSRTTAATGQSFIRAGAPGKSPRVVDKNPAPGEGTSGQRGPNTRAARDGHRSPGGPRDGEGHTALESNLTGNHKIGASPGDPTGAPAPCDPRSSAPCDARSSTGALAPCDPRSSTGALAPCDPRSSTGALAPCDPRSSTRAPAPCDPRSPTGAPAPCDPRSSTRAPATCDPRSSTGAPAPCDPRSSTRAPAPCDPRSSTGAPAPCDPRAPATCDPRSSTGAPATCDPRSSTGAPAPCDPRSSTRAPAPSDPRSSTRAPAPCDPRSSTRAPAPSDPRSSTGAPAPCDPRSSTRAPAPCDPRAPAPCDPRSSTGATLMKGDSGVVAGQTTECRGDEALKPGDKFNVRPKTSDPGTGNSGGRRVVEEVSDYQVVPGWSSSGPGAPVGRRPFTREEDLAIILYVRENKAAKRSVTGTLLWKELEQKRLLSRTWQAMKCRYIKYIVKHRRQYALPPEGPLQETAKTAPTERGRNITPPQGAPSDTTRDVTALPPAKTPLTGPHPREDPPRAAGSGGAEIGEGGCTDLITDDDEGTVIRRLRNTNQRIGSEMAPKPVQENRDPSSGRKEGVGGISLESTVNV